MHQKKSARLHAHSQMNSNYKVNITYNYCRINHDLKKSKIEDTCQNDDKTVQLQSAIARDAATWLVFFFGFRSSGRTWTELKQWANGYGHGIHSQVFWSIQWSKKEAAQHIIHAEQQRVVSFTHKKKTAKIIIIMAFFVFLSSKIWSLVWPFFTRFILIIAICKLNNE